MHLLQPELEKVRDKFIRSYPAQPKSFGTVELDKVFPEGTAMFAITDLQSPKPIYLCRSGRKWIGVDSNFLAKWDFGIFRKFLHPDNIFIVSQGVNHFVKHPKEPFSFSIRIKHVSGEWRWLYALSIPLYTSDQSNVTHSLTILEPLRELFHDRKLERVQSSILTEKELQNLEKLSAREKVILTELSKDLSIEETAEGLHLSANTLRTHQRNIRKKLMVRSAAGLVRYGIYLSTIYD